MRGPRGGRWAASLGLGDCTGRGGESSGSPEVVVLVLLGVGGQQGPWEGASHKGWLVATKGLVLRAGARAQPRGPCPAALAAHLTGYGHWELGGTKR